MVKIERVYVKNINVDPAEFRQAVLLICDSMHTINRDTITFMDLPMTQYLKLLELMDDMASDAKIILINSGSI